MLRVFNYFVVKLERLRVLLQTVFDTRYLRPFTALVEALADSHLTSSSPLASKVGKRNAWYS